VSKRKTRSVEVAEMVARGMPSDGAALVCNSMACLRGAVSMRDLFRRELAESDSLRRKLIAVGVPLEAPIESVRAWFKQRNDELHAARVEVVQARQRAEVAISAHDKARAERDDLRAALAKMTDERDEARELLRAAELDSAQWRAALHEERELYLRTYLRLRATRRRALLLGADRRDWKRVAMKRAAANEQLREGNKRLEARLAFDDDDSISLADLLRVQDQRNRALRTVSKLRRAVLMHSAARCYGRMIDSFINRDGAKDDGYRDHWNERAKWCGAIGEVLDRRARDQSNDAKWATK